MRELDQRLMARAATAVRRAVPSHRWGEFANAITADRTQGESILRKPPSEINRTMFGSLDAFKRDGVATVPFSLGPKNIAAIREHLEGLPVCAGSHILSSDRKLRPLADVRASHPLAGYTMDQLIRAPFLVDLFNQSTIVDFVEAYLGCVPTLYSLNAWWSFPAKTPEGLNAQYFHRDTDDWRFCTLFLYLTDVDEDGGPHQVVKGSQTLDRMQRLVSAAKERGLDTSGFDTERSFVDHFGREFSLQCETIFADDVWNGLGPAGTMFLVNTIALHRGLMAKQKPRLVVWARYGLGPNTNSADLEQGTLNSKQVPANLPQTPRNRYINRLLFEADREL